MGLPTSGATDRQRRRPSAGWRLRRVPDFYRRRRAVATACRSPHEASGGRRSPARRPWSRPATAGDQRGNRGAHPSVQLVTSIAQGLGLCPDERDHLLRLSGHNPPARGAAGEHISPGLLRILDCLDDTPAEIVTELGETLRQSPLGIALTGDRTRYTGPARSIGYRWFTDPTTRQLYDPDDHPLLTRTFTAGLRHVAALRGPGSRAAQLADRLLAQSDEFRGAWNAHEVRVRPVAVKRLVHPEVGALELTCQSLLDPDQSHRLLVFAAVPDSESDKKLQQLSVIASRTSG